MNTVSEIQILYNKLDFVRVLNSKETESFCREIWKPENLIIFEEFKVIFLNRSNKIIGYRTISQGGLYSTCVDLRLIFSIALKSLATDLILVHNHPSGNASPSEADMTITKKIQEVAKFHEIKILDHIILTENDYFSFAKEGYL